MRKKLVLRHLVEFHVPWHCHFSVARETLKRDTVHPNDLRFLKALAASQKLWNALMWASQSVLATLQSSLRAQYVL